MPTWTERAHIVGDGIGQLLENEAKPRLATAQNLKWRMSILWLRSGKVKRDVDRGYKELGPQQLKQGISLELTS